MLWRPPEARFFADRQGSRVLPSIVVRAVHGRSVATPLRTMTLSRIPLLLNANRVVRGPRGDAPWVVSTTSDGLVGVALPVRG